MKSDCQLSELNRDEGRVIRFTIIEAEIGVISKKVVWLARRELRYILGNCRLW